MAEKKKENDVKDEKLEKLEGREIVEEPLPENNPPASRVGNEITRAENRLTTAGQEYINLAKFLVEEVREKLNEEDQKKLDKLMIVV